ncbi:YczE/YyaS/YitT family protein [Intestinicryptomonas porci]|uniref:DUF6198 family protein n=1 Tax=Intestinicryptomonas porci TaxID=2926320 RepID=A0ABU4WFH3_9BACT|nr:DUF6198 family protein [Opitutales bacterium CLA-KB-P66]
MNIFKKIIIFVLAIFLCALGIAVSTQTELGTTPISTLPYVLTFIAPLSFGVSTAIICAVFMLLQILILKNNFKLVEYLQMAVAVCFGLFIDIGMRLAEPFKSGIYACNIIMLVVGSAILAFGICLECHADFLYVPGEGLVRAVSSKYGFEFGKIKVLFDLLLCFLSAVLSIAVLHEIHGLGEGTVMSAVLVGTFVYLFRRIWFLHAK